jgi:hypothetical protein
MNIKNKLYSDREKSVSSSAETQPDAEKNVWEYVPFENFRLPSVPAASAAAGMWNSFRRIVKAGKEEEIFSESANDLYALPSRLEKFVLPQIDSEDAVKALDSALSLWLDSPDNDNSVVYIAGQPYSRNDEIVRMWGESHNAELIEPPDYDEILSGSENLPGNFPESGRLWVLPNLEKFFLRHENGLKKIRKLLEAANSGKLGKGVIGCQSFAWSYLQLVFRFSKKNVLTLQAFDNVKFAALLSKGVRSSKYTRFKFLNMVNGKKITGISAEKEIPDPFFTRLAAYCRGNIRQQVDLWKDRLRLENVNLKIDEKEISAQGEESGVNETVIWVSPEIPEPVLPSQMDDDLVIILHILMLHDGLPEYILYKILPFSEPRCRSGLSFLAGSGLVKNCEGIFFVSETAFFAVRKMLFGRDYLVDKL